MPDKKQKGRDYPLAPTSIPKAIDNTYVQKRNARAEEAAPHFKNSREDFAIANEMYRNSKYNSQGYPALRQKELGDFFAGNAYRERKKADSILRKKP